MDLTFVVFLGSAWNSSPALTHLLNYFNRTLGQLEWWAVAVRDGRAARDPQARSSAFRRRVSERDAPSSG